jgi:hypothetical protein
MLKDLLGPVVRMNKKKKRTPCGGSPALENVST